MLFFHVEAHVHMIYYKMNLPLVAKILLTFQNDQQKQHNKSAEGYFC